MRTTLREKVIDELGVPDVAQHDVVRIEHCPAVDRQLYRVEGGLVAIQHDQLVRLEVRHLPTDLGSDRSARSCHQDPLMGEVARHGTNVCIDLAPTEEISDIAV